MQKELQFLEEQDISPTLLAQVEAFRQEYPADEAALQRVNRPNIPFYGKEILEMAMAALLQGSNLLLSGAKATPVKIFWRRIWHGSSADLLIIFPSMSIRTAVR